MVNYEAIRNMLIAGVFIFIIAFVIKNKVFKVEKELMYMAESPYFLKARFISLLITAFCYISYSLYGYFFYDLETERVALIPFLILIVPISTWVIVKVHELRDRIRDGNRST